MDGRTTRRGALAGAAGATAAAGLGRLLTAEPARAEAAPLISRGRTKIVVLGSQGGQQITQQTGANVRCGTSVLIDVDGVLTVLDCGCGSAHRLAEAGYDMNAVRHVVITHHHADHVTDLASIALLAWSSGRNGGDPSRRLDVHGPTGTLDYAAGVRRAYRISIADQQGPLAQRPTFDRFARWHQLAPPPKVTKVFADARIDVRAIRVNHGSVPAVGYRIRTPDVDVVFSGDRGPTGDRFGTLARGADVLFHEIIYRDVVVSTLQQQQTPRSFIEHLVGDHCDPRAVGRVATAAGVGTLVLYHLIPGTPLVTDDMWRDLVAPHYAGRIVVARDLMVV
jgi:ribonuclease BN (tRNA processing enzyme)